jgi:hypothetical protein
MQEAAQEHQTTTEPEQASAADTDLPAAPQHEAVIAPEPEPATEIEEPPEKQLVPA